MTETEYDTKDEQAFVRAVRANNYEHLYLHKDLVLITDIEDDGEFRPFLSVENDEYDEEYIAELLNELSWLEFENVEVGGQDAINFDFCEVYDAEFNDPANPPTGMKA